MDLSTNNILIEGYKRSSKMNLRDLFMIVLVVWLESPYQNFMNFIVFGIVWVLWLIAAALKSPWAFSKMFLNKGAIILFLWTAVYCVLSLVGRESFSAFQFFYPLLAICLLYYAALNDYYKLKVFIAFYVLYSCLIGVGSIIALINNPMISRDLASSDQSITSQYATPLIANFSTVNNYPLICCVILYCIKFKLFSKTEKRIAIIVLLLDAIVVFLSQYVIAIITLLLATILIHFLKPRKIVVLLLSFVGMMLAIIVLCFGEDLLQILPSSTDNSVVLDRFKEIVSFLSSGSTGRKTDLQIRMELYSRSVSTFWAHPLIGVGGSVYKANGLVGGHSQFLDVLAYHGLFLGGFFIYSYYAIFREYRKRFQYFFKKVFDITFLFYFIDNILNLCYTPEMQFCMFFIIPAVLLVLQSECNLAGENKSER